MLRRRLWYLIFLIGCFGFYIAYSRWLSWILLLTALCLPLLSILLSLPSMLLSDFKLLTPKVVMVGKQFPVELCVKCPIQPPPITWDYQIASSYGDKGVQMQEKVVFAQHCGHIRVELKNAWKYDFLGLFRWKLPKSLQASVLVWPEPIPVYDLPRSRHARGLVWKPLNGGFSENYDLRTYRPGDSLRQIHWKLSAKTGRYIIREPIVPIRDRAVVTMSLSGTANEIDLKLGRFYYVAKELLKKDTAHELHYSCADGSFVRSIANEQELQLVMTELLSARPAEHCTIPQASASWQYHIGGEPDET